jgi:hypothetical protein
MKRFHVHVSVDDLVQSIRFYSTLFAAEPATIKDDYAKWMLDDPRVNFAISQRDGSPGVQHLGIQAKSNAAKGGRGQQRPRAKCSRRPRAEGREGVVVDHRYLSCGPRYVVPLRVPRLCGSAVGCQLLVGRLGSPISPIHRGGFHAHQRGASGCGRLGSMCASF